MLKRLPTDLSTFSELRKLNYLYVDKTQYAYNLITGGRRFFLSRPRRFGKTLFVSTLQSALEGNKELFEGLWIAQSDYQWKKHAIIALDFSRLDFEDTLEKFENSLIKRLHNIAKFYAVSIGNSSAKAALDDLVNALHEKIGAVAILIDEYDKPILHNLARPEFAKEIRSKISNFFSIIKANDAIVNFAFITGVASFSRAGLFSGINNLNILTLDEQYAAICGYTDLEVDANFAPYITAWAEKDRLPYEKIRSQIKEWYNGYHFGEKVLAVYNPYSLTNAFNRQKFINFWVQSGTPTFLIYSIKKCRTEFDPEDLSEQSNLLEVFEIEDMPINVLMFQAGYLTIESYDEKSKRCQLKYPNSEVAQAVKEYMLQGLASISTSQLTRFSSQLYTALNSKDIDLFVFVLTQLFAHIPYQLYIKQEKFYHALLQMMLSTAGFDAQSEYSTDQGRIDLVVEVDKFVYLIEAKFNTPAAVALKQIQTKQYMQRFVNTKKAVVLVGLNFIKMPDKPFKIEYLVQEMA